MFINTPKWGWSGSCDPLFVSVRLGISNGAIVTVACFVGFEDSHIFVYFIVWCVLISVHFRLLLSKSYYFLLETHSVLVADWTHCFAITCSEHFSSICWCLGCNSNQCWKCATYDEGISWQAEEGGRCHSLYTARSKDTLLFAELINPTAWQPAICALLGHSMGP